MSGSTYVTVLVTSLQISGILKETKLKIEDLEVVPGKKKKRLCQWNNNHLSLKTFFSDLRNKNLI